MSKEKDFKCGNSNCENNQSEFMISDIDKLFRLLFGGEQLEEENDYGEYDMSDCESCHMKSECIKYLLKQKEMNEEEMNDHCENTSSKITDSEKINEVASMIMRLQHDIDNIQKMINDINKKVSDKNNYDKMQSTSELQEIKISEDDIVDKIYKKLKKKLINQNSENNKYVTELSAALSGEYKHVRSLIHQNQLIMETIVSELKSISENVDLLTTSMDEQKQNITILESTIKPRKVSTKGKSAND